MEIDGKIVFFNEAEAVYALTKDEEDEDKPPKEHPKKKKGKRINDIKNLPVVPVLHMMTGEELENEFGKEGWYQLEDEIYNRYRFVPTKIEIEEHHVGVYKSKTDGHFIKARHAGKVHFHILH